jgi:hypothetical protein
VAVDQIAGDVAQVLVDDVCVGAEQFVALELRGAERRRRRSFRDRSALPVAYELAGELADPLLYAEPPPDRRQSSG